MICMPFFLFCFIFQHLFKCVDCVVSDGRISDG
jgi:hypothetical protein